MEITYDYPVAGERDISDLDDKDFVRLRRKKNKIVLLTVSYTHLTLPTILLV